MTRKNTSHYYTAVPRRPLGRDTVTLQDILNSVKYPTHVAQITRLSALFGKPLSDLPADLNWFDANFPPSSEIKYGRMVGVHPLWRSEYAYARWRASTRRLIDRNGDIIACQRAAQNLLANLIADRVAMSSGHFDRPFVGPISSGELAHKDRKGN